MANTNEPTNNELGDLIFSLNLIQEGTTRASIAKAFVAWVKTLDPEFDEIVFYNLCRVSQYVTDEDDTN